MTLLPVCQVQEAAGTFWPDLRTPALSIALGYHTELLSWKLPRLVKSTSRKGGRAATLTKCVELLANARGWVASPA